MARWYVREGYEIIARNWRCPRGELDIVAWRDGVLVVCEVKARRNTNFGDPFEAITPRKVLRLRRATSALLESLRTPEALQHVKHDTIGRISRLREIRFDAASVVGSRVVMRFGVQ